MIAVKDDVISDRMDGRRGCIGLIDGMQIVVSLIYDAMMLPLRRLDVGACILSFELLLLFP